MLSAGILSIVYDQEGFGHGYFELPNFVLFVMPESFRSLRKFSAKKGDSPPSGKGTVPFWLQLRPGRAIWRHHRAVKLG